MLDLQTQIEAALRRAVAAAWGEAHADADPIVRPSGNPKFGDYQANLAMSLGKRLGQKPRDVAEKIVAALAGEGGELFDEVSVAGPGFINLRLTEATLAEHAAAMLRDEKLGARLPGALPGTLPGAVVVDYSSPNVAKEMHVGHLRSTIIGDAIARLLEYLGQTVIRQNHLGDWGTQFGMLIEYMNEQGVGGDASGDASGDTSGGGIGDLNRLYQQAKQRFDSDPAFADRARQRVVALQSGDEATLALWRQLVEASKRHFNAAYQRLGVELHDADIRGESFYNDKLAGVVEALDRAGELKVSEGAAVVYPAGFSDREDHALPMIVRKSDGGYLYATTDLAAARYRIDELHATRIIYVTDARQAQHFAMLFQMLKQLGWAGENVHLNHVPFGTVLGKNRRPFKTREGGTVRLSDLIDEAERRAGEVLAAKNPDLSAEQRQAIAHVVGVGALKYADLSNDRIKDYVFDFDRMLALDGNTAPYLQNAYVRIRSIFRKGGIDPSTLDPAAIRVTQDAERALVLKLLQFGPTVLGVADSLEPHRLCNYLYELASGYHQFYEHCPVLTAPDEATRQSRLTLSHLVAKTLQQGLALLGIDVVEQM